jgi:hypothetical protein
VATNVHFLFFGFIYLLICFLLFMLISGAAAKKHVFNLLCIYLLIDLLLITLVLRWRDFKTCRSCLREPR